jgi:hypothetical protein
LIILSLIPTLVLTPLPASAGVLLGVDVRMSYEDNVVGLLSDKQLGVSGGMTGGGGTMMQAMSMGTGTGMGGGQPQYIGSQSSSDFSSTISAEAGGYMDISAETALFAKGFAQHTAYNKFTDFNSTIAGASTGANVIMGDGLSGRLTLYGKIKHFGDSNRNSKAYGATINLKQKLFPALWFREYVEYEDNRADSSAFSYIGTTIGISAGYEVMETLFLTSGYSYLVQNYRNVGSKLITNTASLSLEKRLAKAWSVGGEYDRQISKPDGGSSVTDNIFSLALRYTY